MRVLVFEFATSFWSLAEREFGEAAKSLLCEGTAMAAAVAADFTALADVEVVGVRDARLTDLPPPLDRFRAIQGRGSDWKIDDALSHADFVLPIMPETRGILRSLVEHLERCSYRLLCPSSAFVAWATDKHATLETLRSKGVPTPAGVRLTADDSWPGGFPFPAVLKPNDACGSDDVQLLKESRDCRRRIQSQNSRLPPHDPVWRLEQWVPGRPASVAMLRGLKGTTFLPACEQRLSNDGRFTYFGGSCPLAPALAARAEKIARRADAAMPEGFGYVGIDMILGESADGSQDYVIEVNPRLTTSYIGLRALCQSNLARAMLDVAAGREPALSFRPGCVAFDADGAVRYAGPSEVVQASAQSDE